MKKFNLEEYLANPSRKVVTREGRNVRILCIDKKGTDYPIVALVETQTKDVEETFSFTKNGNWSIVGKDSINDLCFAPEKHEGYVNIYRDIYNGTHAGPIFNSKEEAIREVRDVSIEEKPLSNYITTIKIEWEE